MTLMQQAGGYHPATVKGYVDWETFFQTFEAKNLALLAQDEIDGGMSKFFKFVER
jgi:hypothetical protein